MRFWGQCLALVRFAVGLGVALTSGVAWGQEAQVKADAAMVVTCIDQKAGPEGDLPSAGPTRDRILREMAGGPAACSGLVKNACRKAGGAIDVCTARESRAWLEALKLDPGATGELTKTQRRAWTTAAAGIEPQAIKLCTAAAALAAWGRDTFVAKGGYPMTLTSDCVRSAIAAQATVMLVEVRGN